MQPEVPAERRDFFIEKPDSWRGRQSMCRSHDSLPDSAAFKPAAPFRPALPAVFFEQATDVGTGLPAARPAIGALLRSTGNFAQNRKGAGPGTYKFGDTKVGVNFSENKDKKGFTLTGASSLNSIKNRAYTLGVYHSLNKYVTLVVEFNDERVTKVADSNFDNKNRTLSFGGLIFF